MSWSPLRKDVSIPTKMADQGFDLNITLSFACEHNLVWGGFSLELAVYIDGNLGTVCLLCCGEGAGGGVGWEGKGVLGGGDFFLWDWCLDYQLKGREGVWVQI